MRRFCYLILISSLAAATLPAAAQTLIGTVPIGNGASYLAPNTSTNKIYVDNFNDNTVTVINGATDTTSTIAVGLHPEFHVVNPVTNKIYVNNRKDSTISVINGATDTVSKTISGFDHPIVSDINPVTNKLYVPNSGNGTNNTMGIVDGNTDTLINTITVGLVPIAAAVNPVTNKIYVINQCGSDNNCVSQATVTVVDGATLQTSTVTVGYNAGVILINTVTNKIYVMNSCGNSQDCFINGTTAQGTVTVIDGATNTTETVNTGNGSGALALNMVTNEAFVANSVDNTVTVIDGATLATSQLTVGTSPADVEVNPATNKIYVTNFGSNNVSMIDGLTHHITTIGVGSGPAPATINPVTNRYYNINTNDNTVSVVQGAGANALQFVPLTPCRVVDTRNTNGTFGGPPINGGGYRDFPLPEGNCGIPANAAGYSLNVTLIPLGGPVGYLTMWPTGELQPTVSTMNSPDGRIKANAAIVPAGASGAVRVYTTNTADVLLDINGYFITPDSSTLAFYKMTPCRLVDTRGANGSLGGPVLVAQQERDFPVQTSPCIPSGLNIRAYSLNFTAVPHTANLPLDYLTVWPKGQTQPVVSTLNNPTGTVVANAAIVPAGTGGAIAVYAYDETDLLVDIDGYFAAPGSGGLSLYSVAPCRVLDTRGSGGSFVGQQVVNVVGSSCAPPSTAQAYVLNATVLPNVALGYLTLWPNGLSQPVVSTLNAYDGVTTSNMAIVPTSNGSIDAYASDLTQLILDISSYFAP